jgi:hypothetical protein
LDDAGEVCGLGERQLECRGPEPGLGGRLDPVGAAPEVHGVEVGLEDLVLRELLLELDGEVRLLDLLPQVPRGARAGRVLQVLLGDGRAALDGGTGPDIGPDAAGQGPVVHALVLVEGGVLDVDDGLAHDGRHLVESDRLPVLGSVQGGEQRPVGGEDLRGQALAFVEVDRELGRLPRRAGAREHTHHSNCREDAPAGCVTCLPSHMRSPYEISAAARSR